MSKDWNNKIDAAHKAIDALALAQDERVASAHSNRVELAVICDDLSQMSDLELDAFVTWLNDKLRSVATYTKVKRVERIRRA